ncbi:MAG: M20/M25/M40 family metallo-hydrolase [Vicinamibacterales bacterium]|nr:M20/M25/M40 family metallo-hydrolase [Vicinamibacterales bacterium]MDP6609680.1 M20/M25/M40 family metallo-hydrolase [Vicinamibacterales bacterium]
MTRPTATRRSAAVVASAMLATLGFAPAVAVGQQSPAQPHVEALAADALDGRLTGSAGARGAADYIVSQLGAIGAQPLPGRFDFRLPFEFTAGVNDAGTSIAFGEAAWRESEEVQALSFSDSARVESEVVFAGYGLVVPESQDFGYDSYATLDVTDKIVVVLRYFPEDVDQELRGILSRYSGLRYKAMAARQRGAKALVVLTGPRSPNAGLTVPMTFDTAISGSGIAAASVSGTVGDALFEHVPDRTVEEMQAELDSGNPHVAGFAIDSVTLTLDVSVTREQHTGYNVAGYLPPTGAPVASDAKPYVLLGAHYDHLGHGLQGNSLARESERGEVHNGADDNASGVAAVLEAGRALADVERGRGVLLAFWSGEELGLLGSASFVDTEPVPMAEISAYLNFDMVGRARDNRLALQAVGSSPNWEGLIERANVPVGFNVQIQSDPYLPTDVMSFNGAEVPSLNFFTGSHEDYHRPSDDPAGINYEDLDRVVRLGTIIARNIANQESPLEFVRVEQVEQQGQRASLRAFTGTIPDYTAEVEGMLLGGVIEGGPAAEGGLLDGDVIVEFAGQTITNIYDYTYALDAIKVDEPITVVFIRDGEKHEIVMTPTARR